MTWLSDIFKGGTEGTVKGAFSGIGTLAKDIRVAITGKDPLTSEQQYEIAQKLNNIEEMAQAASANYDTIQLQGQMDLLRQDQQSTSFWKSGWRPMVAWTCAFGLFYTFVLRPILPWAVAVSGVEGVPPLPALEMKELLSLLFGMLGLGTMRSIERMRGKA